MTAIGYIAYLFLALFIGRILWHNYGTRIKKHIHWLKPEPFHILCLLISVLLLAFGPMSPLMSDDATRYHPDLIGKPMALGERPYDAEKYTCASWDYPLGTFLCVTNKGDGRRVIVRVTDRHDFKTDIDLSFIAYTELRDWDTHDSGHIDVEIEEVE